VTAVAMPLLRREFREVHFDFDSSSAEAVWAWL